MANILHFAYGVTGGGASDLDGILLASITDGDMCLVGDGNDRTYAYDASETAVESSPNIINPDDNTGDGRWILQKQSGVPIGTSIEWRTDTVPDDYLENDGSTLDTTVYAALFAVFGYMYGGSGSSFNLPDDRGEGKRGYDHGRGADPDAASRTDRGDGTTGDNVGTKQADQFKSHNHSTYHYPDGDGIYGGTGGSGGITNQPTGAAGGNETRGRNISAMYCTKFQ